MINGTNSSFRILSLLAIALFLICGCKKATDAGAGQTDGTDAVGAAAGKPVISALEAEFDFGTVKQGAEVSHTFKIKNTGDKNLVIERTTGS